MSRDNYGEPLTFEGLQKTMLGFRAKFGRPLKAIRISDETQRQMERMFPMYRAATPADALYGVRIEIDNDLELWECVPVYASKRAVTCWICGGNGPLICQCHNGPEGKRPLPCNMVCNA